MYASHAYPELFVKHYGFVDDVILMEQCQTDAFQIWKGYVSTRMGRNKLNLFMEGIHM